MKDEIKKATQLAENELQEKLIENLKKTIKNLLQRKRDKEEERDKLDEEIKLIKQSIDDFKAGRLDKIKERNELNPKAREVCPIQITIINDNSRINYPTQPWKWNYDVVWQYTPLVQTGSLTYYNGNSGAITLCNTSATANGTTLASFTSGTYQVNGDFINL